MLHYTNLKDIFNLKIHGTEKQIKMITMYTYGMLALKEAQRNGIKKVIFNFLAKRKEKKEKKFTSDE